MPEGDTIHRAARRLNLALAGRELELAAAPNPRSPLHNRAYELEGRTLEQAEARGKHLLAHFSDGLVVHSHLGINGRFYVRGDGGASRSKPWLRIGAGDASAEQFGGKLLRLVSESRARNDPALAQLGPDPLAAGFDADEAAARLLSAGAAREVGDVLLDQSVIAGIGNAIKAEVLFRAKISPWRRLEDLSADEAASLIAATEEVMKVSLARGRRPRSIYRTAGRPCRRCGTTISSRGQGDANRTAYWCPNCQR
jgi:endonuclease-8